MINFYLLPFFHEKPNWKEFQRPLFRSISTQIVVDFFYLEVKKMRRSCLAKINSARHNLLDLKERGSKNKNPMNEVHWVFESLIFLRGRNSLGIGLAQSAVSPIYTLLVLYTTNRTPIRAIRVTNASI